MKKTRNRDREAGLKLVTSDFDSDFIGREVVIPIAGIYPRLADYKLVDAKRISDNLIRVRVALIEVGDETTTSIHQQNLDFDVSLQSSAPLISGIWRAGEQELKDYEVFPGLTYTDK